MTLKEQINKLTEELVEENDKYIRLAADFQNYKRNKEQEIMNIRNSASRDVIIALVDVIDDIKRGMAVNGEKDGLALIYNKLLKVLDDNGAEMYGNEGDIFDPEIFEAVFMEETDGESGFVTKVISSGCAINGKIVKHAKVAVSK